jgi:hypothetical protein
MTHNVIAPSSIDGGEQGNDALQNDPAGRRAVPPAAPLVRDQTDRFAYLQLGFQCPL